MQNIKLFRLFSLLRTMPIASSLFFSSFYALSLLLLVSGKSELGVDLCRSIDGRKMIFFSPRIETRSRVVIVVLVEDIKIHFQIKFSFTFALRNVDEIKKVNWWHSRDFRIERRVCVLDEMEVNSNGIELNCCCCAVFRNWMLCEDFWIHFLSLSPFQVIVERQMEIK